MQTFLRESYISSVHSEVPSSGNIFSLPILSQLGIMLPRYLLLEGMSVDWTASIDQRNLSKLKDHIAQMPPIIFLVSEERQDEHIKCCLFYPKGSVKEEEKPCILQLEPVHRIFRTASSKKENVSIQVDSDNMTLVASITWERESSITDESGWKSPALTSSLAIEYDTMELVVLEEGLGQFMVERENHSTVNVPLCIDAVELLKCDHQRIFVEDFEY